MASVGGLSVVCEDAEIAARVLGQLKATVRRIYSSPPCFRRSGGRYGLGDEALKRAGWRKVDAMRNRIAYRCARRW